VTVKLPWRAERLDPASDFRTMLGKGEITYVTRNTKTKKQTIITRAGSMWCKDSDVSISEEGNSDTCKGGRVGSI
jgi:hypothetical protein